VSSAPVTLLYKLTPQGIPSKILKIEWPGGVTPSSLSDFETLARRYRYQALGKACRDENLESLILAHHADDQVETVLMRLLAGHKGIGLRGMKRSTQIPECYGIHGVHRSGLLDAAVQPLGLEDDVQVKASAVQDHQILLDPPDLLDPSPHQKDSHSQQSSPHSTIMEVERGGVRVGRPLLPWTKDNLVATCQKYSIPWFEDLTNADPTLTMRNAIRHVYSSYSLPKALNKERLLLLAKKRMIHEDSIVHDLAEKRFWVVRLEPRAGTITVRFARRKHELSKMSRDQSSLLLRCLWGHVSPNEHLMVRGFYSASRIVFPYLYNSPDSSSESPTKKVSSVANVRYERRAGTISDEPWKDLKCKESDSLILEDHEWFVTRQPHVRNVSLQPLLQIPPLSSQNYEAPFCLYDGRYWIQVKNFTSTTLHVRPFREEDLKVLRSNLEDDEKKKLNDLLKTLAPGHVRWTLPAIVENCTPDGERVVALPSLDIVISGAKELMSYKIRYKELDSFVRQNGDTLHHQLRQR
jgi:tRNA(Ile)-lysidine synthase